MAKSCMANLAPMISPGISGVSFEKLAEAEDLLPKGCQNWNPTSWDGPDKKESRLFTKTYNNRS